MKFILVTKFPPARLWFGFAGSAASWITLGVADIVITWRVCPDRGPIWRMSHLAAFFPDCIFCSYLSCC